MTSDIKKINQRNVEAFHEFGGEIKHAARCRLWLPEAHSLKQEKGKCLKYFTLPGKWAYDVFLLENNGIIAKSQRGFPDVRFCDNNANFYATAKRLLGNTIGIQSNFERAVLQDKREFWDSFPYDIYNLDFCGTCFPNDQPPFSQTFEAVTKIIEEHVRRRYFPFIVFLTMKALAGETNMQAQRELVGNIESNRAEPEFAAAFDRTIPDTADFVENRFSDFILLSVPKLICHLARAHCDVDVRQRAKYSRRSRGEAQYFITKFVFKFSRRRRTLRIRDSHYIDNVLRIVRLDDIVTIENSSITDEVRQSLAKIKSHLRGLGY